MLITGGNGGIGLGIARACARAGANLIVWGRNPDKNAEAEADLRSLGVEAHALSSMPLTRTLSMPASTSRLNSPAVASIRCSRTPVSVVTAPVSPTPRSTVATSHDHQPRRGFCCSAPPPTT